MTADVKSDAAQVDEAVPVEREEAVKAVAVEQSPEEPKTEAAEDNIPEDPTMDSSSDSTATATVTVTVTKSSSYKEESNFLADLKEHERKALIEFKSQLVKAITDNKLFKVEENQEKKEADTNGDAEAESSDPDAVEVSIWGLPLLPSKSSESTDVVLLKFLRAREFRVKEALEMLKNTLQWRKLSKIDSILDEVSLGEDFRTACYMDGVDLEGHPVCYNVIGVFQDESLYQKAFGSTEGRDRFLRWRVHQMEQGIKKLDLTPGGTSLLLQITDLKNSPGLSKKELRITMRHAVDLLQDNYPEFVARNIIINAPFWYYAFHALLSPFLTQRTKSKMVIVRPAKVTETLLKYIPAEAIPVQYGGLKRDDDTDFTVEDGGVSELTVKAVSTETIEIPAPEVGSIVVWDLTVLGWEVNYKEEFVPTDEGSYTIIIQKGKKMGSQEEAVRNSFTNNEPGKIVLSIENKALKKKKVLYRYKTRSC